jgi:HK97 family phage portal protein
MSIFNFRKKQNKEQEQRSLIGLDTALNFSTFSSFTSGDAAMKLSAVYRAVDLISDSIAMLPLEVQLVTDGYKTKHINHTAYDLLNKQPSNLMSRYTFIKLLVSSVILRGNGFAYIQRDGAGNATSLIFLRPENVAISYNELTGKLNYYSSQVKGVIEPCNILHFVKYSLDGINGISVLQNARNTLGLSYDTEAQAAQFYKSGCNLQGVLTAEGQLNETQINNIKSSWNKAYAGNGVGSGLAVLQGNMTYQPIQISSKDAQLIESRQFNLTDIARFFGISPVMLGDLTHSSYSTIEATQLAFLSQTIQPWLELFELEFSRKIFKPSEKNLSVNFDDSKLIKTDKSALATYYQQLFNISAITPNEIRREIGLNSIDGGDSTYMQLNMSTTKNINENTNNSSISDTNIE